MSYNKRKYTDNYNKTNYKMYQFRVKYDDSETIKFLDEIDNRNEFIIELIKKRFDNEVLSIKKIKQSIKPIIDKYEIKELYLFGSYARGEANRNSDIDIYCDKGIAKTFIMQQRLIDELENALGKKVDFVTTTSTLSEDFKKNLMEDRIRLW